MGKLSEVIGNFIDNHPWLIFLTVNTAIIAVPLTIAAIRRVPLITVNHKTTYR